MATKKSAATITKTLHFKFEKETPGAVRYQETNEQGVALKSDMDGATMGTMYLRKQALGAGVVPQAITATLTFSV